jgi:hypothetical protein
MNSIIKNQSVRFITVVVLIVSLFACEKNPTEPGENAPPLPPAESMKLDLSFFPKPSSNSLAKTTLSKQNFTNAALRVWIIHTAVSLAAIVPTVVFVAAINQEAELQPDGKFHWIYTVQNNNDTFSADLAGWVDQASKEIVWEMYVSCNTHSPELDHFLWYEGRSKIGNKEGWWLFYDDKSPASMVEVLKVDWQIPDAKHRELVLSNVKQSSNEYGDTLSYTLDNNDNNLVFFDASEVKTNTIYWDSKTGAGFIEWFDYKDGVRSYWDENQDDTTGPPAL